MQKWKGGQGDSPGIHWRCWSLPSMSTMKERQSPWLTSCYIVLSSGLGRVPDLRVRVQVQLLVICVSTSTSRSTWLLHEYEYEYWLMSPSPSPSTGLWCTLLNSSIELFSLWKRESQIFINLGQSSNCPFSMYIPFVNIYPFNYSMQFGTMTLQFTYCDILAVMADNYNFLPVQKQKAQIAQYHEMCGK